VDIDDDFKIRVFKTISENLEINFSEQVQGDIHLIDMSGRVVLTEVLNGMQLKINTELLKNGMYILQIRSNKGTQVFKVLK
jgi:hypothetical protein